MKTKFENINQLKKGVEVGQKLFIENYIKPERSRVAKVKNLLSYFFTVTSAEDENKESWIVNGAVSFKEYGFDFHPEKECVDIFFKKDFRPFVTLHFNETIIKGKESANANNLHPIFDAILTSFTN